MTDLPLTRRTLLRSGALATGAVVLGPAFWQRALASPATATDGPYGPLGGGWGEVADDDAFALLDAAVESGVTFLDTADVYGDGRSEALFGRFLAQRTAGPELTVATKMGRRADPHVADAYTLDAFRCWT